MCIRDRYELAAGRRAALGQRQRHVADLRHQHGQVHRDVAAPQPRELARLRRRDIPVDLAVLMSEIGDVALALTERGAPSRGELVQVAATALAWADVAQRTGLGVAAARDRAADAREIAAPRNESRFACLD